MLDAEPCRAPLPASAAQQQLPAAWASGGENILLPRALPRRQRTPQSHAPCMRAATPLPSPNDQAGYFDSPN